MTPYGSLCRRRELWRLVSGLSQRLVRPATNSGLATVRALSSVHPRRNEALSSVSTGRKAPSAMEMPRQEPVASTPSRTCPPSLTYTGGVTMPITSQLKIVSPGEDPPRGIWPVYRLMVSCGALDCGSHPMLCRNAYSVIASSEARSTMNHHSHTSQIAFFFCRMKMGNSVRPITRPTKLCLSHLPLRTQMRPPKNTSKLFVTFFVRVIPTWPRNFKTMPC